MKHIYEVFNTGYLKKKIYSIFIVALFTFPLIGFSEIVYVSPTGNGLGDGTSWENAAPLYDLFTNYN